MSKKQELPPLENESPLLEILRGGPAGAILLLLSAVLALICANTGLSSWYEHVLHYELGFSFGFYEFKHSVHHWVNDGLMVIFFFLVGLEIKRELLIGELASFRRAFLPGLAALGGMAGPALVYLAFNYGTEASRGWGIPMATDIAFSAGCLALLSGRVPPALTILLLALAIADDLGGVLVIALFYTSDLSFSHLGIGFAILFLSWLLNRLGVRAFKVYFPLGVAVWLCFLESGVHATIAGVLMAFTITPTARYESGHFVSRISTLLERFREAGRQGPSLQVTERQQLIIRHIEQECVHVEAPLQRHEHNIGPFSSLVIMPVFAFVNSGVHIEWTAMGGLLLMPVTLGVGLGLLLGKQAGIMLFAWIAVKTGLAELPRGVEWKHCYGMSILAAIGFTVSLFINELAFRGIENAELAEAYNTEAKLGIMLASVLAGLAGYFYLRAIGKPGEYEAAAHGH